MLADRFKASQDLNIPDIAEDLALYVSELGFTLPTRAIPPLEVGTLNSKDFDASGQTQGTVGRNRPFFSYYHEHMDIAFRPWDKHDCSKEYVKKLDKKLVLRTWGMLYCGGARVVEEELKKIADEYKVCLHVESFAW
jgi:hypothetical protein